MSIPLSSRPESNPEDEASSQSQPSVGVSVGVNGECTPDTMIPPPTYLAPSNIHAPCCSASTVLAQQSDLRLYSLSSSTPSATTVNGDSSSPQSSPEGSISQLVNTEQVTTPEWLKFRLSSGFFAYFLCGWGDSVTGTVLPYFTASYHLNPMTSSLLFAGSTCGFFVGTFIVERVMNFFGQCSIESSNNSRLPYVPFFYLKARKSSASSIRHSASQARHLTLIFSSVLHAMFFIMVGKRGGFAVTFMAYVVAALARSFITATLWNAYYVSGPPQSSLGFAYGLWSVGGVVSPIVCQAIIAKGVPWQNFYFGSLVLSAINCALLFFSFRPTIKENALEWSGYLTEKSSRTSSPACPDEKYQGEVQPQQSPRSHRSHTLRLVLSMPYQWAFSIFALLYSGGETTTSGFTVTYLLGTRHADPQTVGYVTSGYWGGFALARFLWGLFVPRTTFTQRKFIVLGAFWIFLITCHSALALSMHVLLWKINSNIENSVSAACIGLLYGSIFPAILRLTNDILPAEVQMISMGVISAFASVGSALFPFIVGVISRSKGIHTMPYITVPLSIVLIGLWSLFPTRLPRQRSTVV